MIDQPVDDRGARLWPLLRAATAEAHREAEARVEALAEVDSRAGYAALLAVLWGVHAPVEEALDACAWPAAVDWPRRRRTGLLRADLRALGHEPEPPRGAAPPLAAGAAVPLAAGAAPPLAAGAGAAPPAAWGALYVVEGATLGGRVLARRITGRIGPVPMAFLDGRGSRARPMWRELAAAAETAAAPWGPAERTAAVEAAAAVFAAFTARPGPPG